MTQRHSPIRQRQQEERALGAGAFPVSKPAECGTGNHPLGIELSQDDPGGLAELADLLRRSHPTTDQSMRDGFNGVGRPSKADSALGIAKPSVNRHGSGHCEDLTECHWSDDAVVHDDEVDSRPSAAKSGPIRIAASANEAEAPFATYLLDRRHRIRQLATVCIELFRSADCAPDGQI